MLKLGPGRENDDLDIWSRLDLAKLDAVVGNPTPEHPQESVLELEPDAHSAALLGRLANASCRLARALHERGDWNGARARFEAAVRIGERVARVDPNGANFGPAREKQRVAWTLARSCGADAARDLGRAYASLGQPEAAIEWYDRAIATLEGTDIPYGQIELAQALLERAGAENTETLEGPGRQAALLERAGQLAIDSGWTVGRAIASRAGIEWGINRWAQGATEEAASRFRRAFDLAATPEMTSAISAVRALLMLGLLLEDQGDALKAAGELRAAFEFGQGASEPAARHFALIAGCNLTSQLVARRELEAAETILERLDALPAALAPGDRALAAGRVAYARAQVRFESDRRADAADQLSLAERLGTQAGGPRGADLVRHALGLRGMVALAGDQPAQAEAHFRGALATSPGEGPQTREQAERAQARHQLGMTLLRLEQAREARDQFRGALESGVASGRPEGRATAALAAFLLADAFDDPAAERRRLYERAASLGALSGTPRGREVAAAVPERIRQLAG